jgi:hypothetical protein
MNPFFIFTAVTALVGLAGFARDSPANSYIPSSNPDELGKLPEGLELKCVLLRIGIHINTSTRDENDTPRTTPLFLLDQLHQIPYPIALIRKVDESEAPTSSHLDTKAKANIKCLFLKGLSGIDTAYYIEPAGSNNSVTCKGQEPNFGANYVAQCECSALLQ